MGIVPRYRIGDYVVDPEQVKGSESLVRINSRRLMVTPSGLDWIYFGDVFEVQSNPIGLKYKTAVTARESHFVPLISRIEMPR